jgi:tRNA (guanine37-N1)-methyltransferase
MQRPCIAVKSRSAEKARKILFETGLLDNGYQVTKDDKFVIFPLVDGSYPENIPPELSKHEFREMEVEPRKIRPRSFKEMLDLPFELNELVPSSYDIIGDIGIIRLPEELLPHKIDIAKAMREFNRNLKTVCLDKGVKGDLRIRDLEVLDGLRDLETTHVENNLRFKMDPSKVYFSPRLATERMRVARSIEWEERVLDMFSGIGPFSLNIAMHSPAESVVGIDLNPECIHYFQKNITLNSMDEKVEAYLGDSSEVASTLIPFDRIVMNLPHSSMDYLSYALLLLEQGNIHLYRMVEEGGFMKEVARIMEIANYEGKDVNILGTREVHNYSPSQSMMVFDIKVQ